MMESLTLVGWVNISMTLSSSLYIKKSKPTKQQVAIILVAVYYERWVRLLVVSVRGRVGIRVRVRVMVQS